MALCKQEWWPDRRFKNNRKLPILQLGVLLFTSSRGLNLQLNTSIQQAVRPLRNGGMCLFHTSKSQEGGKKAMLNQTTKSKRQLVPWPLGNCWVCMKRHH